MTQGFERREVIEDAQAKPQNLAPKSVSVPGIATPRRADFSRVGETQRKLATALGGAIDMAPKLKAYADKKIDSMKIDGGMQRAEGVTEAEIMETGNRFTQAGWQAMNGKIAGDELYQNELNNIEMDAKAMDSPSYQAYLGEKYTGLRDSLPGGENASKAMLKAWASDQFPKLVSAQIRANNKYNRANTLDSTRKMLTSTALTDGAESATELLDPATYHMPLDDFASSVNAAGRDAYKMQSYNLENAMLAKHAEAGTTGKVDVGPNDVTATLNVIGNAASKNNYTAVGTGDLPELTDMALDDVLAVQAEDIKDNPGMGKYQILRDTLSELKDTLGLTGKEQFGEGLQDQLATAILKKHGVDAYVNGTLSSTKFQTRIAADFPSIPSDSSGRSHESAGGINTAMVEPGKVQDALTSDEKVKRLRSYLTSIGSTSDDINKFFKARDAFQREESARFDADRLLAENGIKRGAINLSEQDLITQIKDLKEEGGYSDAWANGLHGEALTARKAAMKERKKEINIQTLIDTGSVATGTTAEQHKAIDIVTRDAMEANPDAMDPNSANNGDAVKLAMDQVFNFMATNNITDSRLKARWEAATTGSITDGNGRVTPAAMDAYTGYLQARNSVNDPLFSQTLLSPKTQDLFLMADSYRGGQPDADAEQALITASNFLEKENAAKGVNNMPWWNDRSKSIEIEDDLVSTTIPGLLDGFFGIGSSQAQMRWELNQDGVEKAATSADITGRIKQEAAKLWTTMKHRPDQEAAQTLAMTKATSKVLSKSEYVAGTFVYSGDQPTISERIGMSGIKNATNMVVSRVMEGLGSSIWDDFNETDVFTMSQSWYNKPSTGIFDMIGKGAAVGKKIINPLDKPEMVGGLIDKAYEKIRGVPDFQVVFNKGSNVLTLSPYTNAGRTEKSSPYTLSIEKLTEAATFIRLNDEDGFNKWIEEQKLILPPKNKR